MAPQQLSLPFDQPTKTCVYWLAGVIPLDVSKSAGDDQCHISYNGVPLRGDTLCAPSGDTLQDLCAAHLRRIA